jgi:thiol-disulfide isomerase/thioredoxin
MGFETAKVLAGASLLALAWLGAAAATNSVPASRTPAAAVAVSEPARDAAPAQLADAVQFRKILDAERGKVVIVNLWATWCSPCLREIPDLVKLQQELAPRGVILIGLGMDEPDQLQNSIEPFRKKRFPALRSYIRNAPDLDTVVSVVDSAWNEILPTTYILDRKGQIAKKIQGARSYAEFRALVLAAVGP